MTRATVRPGPRTLTRGSPRPATPTLTTPSRATPSRATPPASPEPTSPEPGYPAPAASDPAADAASTQAWETAGHVPAAASHWPDLGTTGEGWPGADDHQDGMPAAAAFAGGLAGAALAGAALAGPGLAGPGLAGPGLADPGLADPGLAGPGHGEPGEGDLDGWDDPRWTGPGEPEGRLEAPRKRARDTAPGPADRAITAPGQRVAAGSPGGDGRAPGGRSRGTRGRARRRGRKKPVRTLLVCLLALAVVASATYLWFSRDHKSPDAAAISQQTAASTRPSPTDPAPSPSPSLGPWGHIGSRALDPVPLTLAELFPAQFTGGGTSYVKTVQKAKTHCVAALMGSQLITAVSQAGCTQAMRASYLSADHKVMGTIGVLNLVTAAAAEKAGKAAGPAEFIAQLPAVTGPTRNLTKGTGFEAAEVKGHYLVLVWVEFADLRAPRSPAQRTELESFISVLFQDTANVSLATREVTGSPPAT